MIKIDESELNKLRKAGLVSDAWIKKLNIVNAVEQTKNISATAKRYGVSRQYVHKLLRTKS